MTKWGHKRYYWRTFVWSGKLNLNDQKLVLCDENESIWLFRMRFFIITFDSYLIFLHHPCECWGMEFLWKYNFALETVLHSKRVGVQCTLDWFFISKQEVFVGKWLFIRKDFSRKINGVFKKKPFTRKRCAPPIWINWIYKQKAAIPLDSPKFLHVRNCAETEKECSSSTFIKNISGAQKLFFCCSCCCSFFKLTY